MDAHEECGRAHAFLERDAVYCSTKVLGFLRNVGTTYLPTYYYPPTYLTTRGSLHTPNILRHEKLVSECKHFLN